MKKELRRSPAALPIGTGHEAGPTYQHDKFAIMKNSAWSSRNALRRTDVCILLNDVDRLLEIKDYYLADGSNPLWPFRKIFNKNTNPVSKESVMDEDVRRIFCDDVCILATLGGENGTYREETNDYT